MPFSLDQLLGVQELPVKDQLGTLKKAEICVTDRKLRGAGRFTSTDNLTYWGNLKDGTCVRVSSLDLRLLPLPNDSDNVDDGSIQRIYGVFLKQHYPNAGDALAVYWFSHNPLPNLFRGEFYVNPLQLPDEQFDLPLFRRHGVSESDKFVNYMVNFGLVVPDKSRKTIMDDFWAGIAKEAAKIRTPLEAHTRRLRQRERGVSADVPPFEPEISEGRNRLLDYIARSSNVFDDISLTRSLVESFDPRPSLADYAMRVAIGKGNRDFDFDCSEALCLFQEAVNTFYAESIARLTALKPNGLDSRVTLSDVLYSLHGALYYAITPVGSITNQSVDPKYGHFGGGERRRSN